MDDNNLSEIDRFVTMMDARNKRLEFKIKAALIEVSRIKLLLEVLEEDLADSDIYSEN